LGGAAGLHTYELPALAFGDDHCVDQSNDLQAATPPQLAENLIDKLAIVKAHHDDWDRAQRVDAACPDTRLGAHPEMELTPETVEQVQSLVRAV
jgi:hypothetical protein